MIIVNFENSDVINDSQANVARLESLFLDEQFADVHFEIDGERVPAQKCILAASCEYFRGLLFGGMREQFQEVVPLDDVDVETFKAALQFIYTGKLVLNSLYCSTDGLLDIAHKYGLESLENQLVLFLEKRIAIGNVFCLLDLALGYLKTSLRRACETFIGKHAKELLTDKSFINLDVLAVKTLLSLTSPSISELEKFQSLQEWRNANKNAEDFETLLSCIDLANISTDDLVCIVEPSGFYSSRDIFDAIRAHSQAAKQLTIPNFPRSKTKTTRKQVAKKFIGLVQVEILKYGDNFTFPRPGCSITNNYISTLASTVPERGQESKRFEFIHVCIQACLLELSVGSRAVLRLPRVIINRGNHVGELDIEILQVK